TCSIKNIAVNIISWAKTGDQRLREIDFVGTRNQTLGTRFLYRDAIKNRSRKSAVREWSDRIEAEIVVSGNMKIENYKKLTALTFALAFLCAGVANAQIQAAGGGYYRAGYPTIYGSFGQASVAQSRMYDQVKVQNRRKTERDALISKWGLGPVEKAERETAAKGAASSNPQIVVSPPPVVRNYGVFR